MRNESAPHAFVRRTECVPYKQWIILSNFLWYMQFKLLRVICTLRSPNALVQVYSYISCYSFSLDVCSLYNTYIRNKLVLRNHFLWRPICHLLHKDKELLALRNNFRVTKKFLIAKSDCSYFVNPLNAIKQQQNILDHCVFGLLHFWNIANLEYDSFGMWSIWITVVALLECYNFGKQQIPKFWIVAGLLDWRNFFTNPWVGEMKTTQQLPRAKRGTLVRVSWNLWSILWTRYF